MSQDESLQDRNLRGDGAERREEKERGVFFLFVDGRYQGVTCRSSLLFRWLSCLGSVSIWSTMMSTVKTKEKKLMMILTLMLEFYFSILCFIYGKMDGSAREVLQ